MFPLSSMWLDHTVTNYSPGPSRSLLDGFCRTTLQLANNVTVWTWG